MTPEDFRAACSLLWGDGFSWGVGKAAQFLGISERNVKRFATGEKVVGDGLASVLVEEVRRRIFDDADETPSLNVLRMAMSKEKAPA